MNLVLPPVQVITKYINRMNLDLFYPVLIGMNNVLIQHKINNNIMSYVNNLIVKQGYYTNPQTQVTGWYELKTNQRGILSVALGNYAYPPHAAHGMTYIISLTFDLLTGKLYQLSDLFKPDSDYIKVLSEAIKIQIKTRDIPLLDGFTTINPNQDFYIGDKALVIYFQLYEITPYYVGLPMFPISVFTVQYMSMENSLIDKMANNG